MPLEKGEEKKSILESLSDSLNKGLCESLELIRSIENSVYRLHEDDKSSEKCLEKGNEEKELKETHHDNLLKVKRLIDKQNYILKNINNSLNNII